MRRAGTGEGRCTANAENVHAEVNVHCRSARRTEREAVGRVRVAVAVDADDELAEVVPLADLLRQLEVLHCAPARTGTAPL